MSIIGCTSYFRAVYEIDHPHIPYQTILYFIVYIMVLRKWRMCSGSGEGAELCKNTIKAGGSTARARSKMCEWVMEWMDGWLDTP